MADENLANNATNEDKVRDFIARAKDENGNVLTNESIIELWKRGDVTGDLQRSTIEMVLKSMGFLVTDDRGMLLSDATKITIQRPEQLYWDIIAKKFQETDNYAVITPLIRDIDQFTGMLSQISPEKIHALFMPEKDGDSVVHHALIQRAVQDRLAPEKFATLKSKVDFALTRTPELGEALSSEWMLNEAVYYAQTQKEFDNAIEGMKAIFDSEGSDFPVTALSVLYIDENKQDGFDAKAALTTLLEVGGIDTSDEVQELVERIKARLDGKASDILWELGRRRREMVLEELSKEDIDNAFNYAEDIGEAVSAGDDTSISTRFNFTGGGKIPKQETETDVMETQNTNDGDEQQVVYAKIVPTPTTEEYDDTKPEDLLSEKVEPVDQTLAEDPTSGDEDEEPQQVVKTEPADEFPPLPERRLKRENIETTSESDGSFLAQIFDGKAQPGALGTEGARILVSYEPEPLQKLAKSALSRATNNIDPNAKAQAIKDLAYAFMNNGNGVKVTDQTREDGVTLLKWSAELGNPQAIRDLAHNTYYGIGPIEQDKEQGYAMARELVTVLEAQEQEDVLSGSEKAALNGAKDFIKMWDKENAALSSSFTGLEKPQLPTHGSSL